MAAGPATRAASPAPKSQPEPISDPKASMTAENKPIFVDLSCISLTSYSNYYSRLAQISLFVASCFGVDFSFHKKRTIMRVNKISNKVVVKYVR